MKVYLDIIFILNFIYDFIVLLSTSIILKRNTKVIRLVLGALFGSLSIFTLFVRFNTISLIMFKLLISIFIVIISYGFNNIKGFIKNIYYFYLISIILGGFIYFFKNQLSYNNGLLFVNDYSLNIILGIILSIIGITIYLKNIKELKLNYNKYIKTTIFFKNYSFKVIGFVDTGNKLKDPYFSKPIILLEKSFIRNEEKLFLVPFKTCNYNGLLKCIKPEKIYIDGFGYRKNLLIGLIDSIKIDGVNCLLNESLMEG